MASLRDAESLADHAETGKTGRGESLRFIDMMRTFGMIDLPGRALNRRYAIAQHFLWPALRETG